MTQRKRACSCLQNDRVLVYMTHFRRSRAQPYTVITPSTPLAELEQFLHDNIFAIGTLSISLPWLAWRLYTNAVVQ